MPLSNQGESEVGRARRGGADFVLYPYIHTLTVNHSGTVYCELSIEHGEIQLAASSRQCAENSRSEDRKQLAASSRQCAENLRTAGRGR